MDAACEGDENARKKTETIYLDAAQARELIKHAEVLTAEEPKVAPKVAPKVVEQISHYEVPTSQERALANLNIDPANRRKYVNLAWVWRVSTAVSDALPYRALHSNASGAVVFY